MGTAGELQPEAVIDGDRQVADRVAADLARDWRVALDRITAGDPAGVEALYALGARSVFGLALWRTGSVEDASDVVQEVFLRIVEDRDRLARVESPRAWLMRLAQNVSVDITRRRSRRPATPLAEVPFLSAPDEEVDRALDAARASRFVGQLPPKQRDAVYLHHFEGFTFREIGTITGVPFFTAASRYRLGMAKLRTLMEVKP